MYIQGEKSIYKGILIVEYPEGTFNAYRSIYYLGAGIAAYSAGHGLSDEAIRTFVDVAGDSGHFTQKQLDDMNIVTNGHKV